MMMDIPDTGAIFTLGKSYLAENTQSYFFIKNDPVNRLICGSTQSAVICDSGRLFVWGENQFGQLGVVSSNLNDKSSHIITKPTCVKSLKTLGLKVRDAAFGDGWCVILTNTNEIYFTGKNIFSKNTKIYKNFENLNKNENNNIKIVKKPFRLKEFNGILLTSKDNNNQINNNDEYFDKLSTGNEHFVLITSTGRLFGWGSNKSNQFGLPGNELLSAVELSPDLKIINFICGPKSTLIQTEMNKFYITGQLNDFHYPKFTELSFNDNAIQQENIKFLHISKSNEIFFVTEKGNIYRGNESARQQNIIFQRFYDYDNEENGPIVKLLKGTLFFAALTQNYKLFTTFSESGHHLKTFREISKFKNLRVFDIAVGDKHVLVMGIPRSVKNFDKNRFFNKTAAVNTPDSNGNLTGKIENKLLSNVTGENENKSDGKYEENEQKNTDGSDLKSVNQNKSENQTNEEPQGTENMKKNVPESNGIKSLSDNDIENSKSTNSAETLSPIKLNNNENQSQSSSQNPQTEKTHSPENENKIQTPEPSNQVEETISETNQEVDTSIVPDSSSTPNKQNITRNSSQDTDESKSSQTSIKQLQKQQSVNSTSSNKMNDDESSKISDSENLKTEENVNHTTENENQSTNSIENDETTTNTDQISPNNEDKSQVNDSVTNEISKISESKKTHAKENAKSPSTSQKSGKGSARSLQFDAKSLKSTKSQDRLVRPNTPYPDGTPQTVKRVQNIIQNNNDDMIENTSLNLADSLENIPEMSPQNSASVTRRPSLKYSDRKEKYDEIVRKASAKPALVLNERYLHLEDDENENDEKLEIEIKTDDILDQTTINEIRFINNGIDVTERIQFEEVPSEPNTSQSIGTSDVKQNINNSEDSKASEEGMDDTLTKDESKLKVTDDDERTTASVNSNKNENQIENDLELKNDKDDFLIQNTQQPEQEYDFYQQQQQNHQQNDQSESTKSKETRKKKVQRFIDDLKSRGKEMTCRADESIRVEDDPPRYTSMDEGLDTKTSKFCTIL